MGVLKGQKEVGIVAGYKSEGKITKRIVLKSGNKYCFAEVKQ